MEALGMDTTKSLLNGVLLNGVAAWPFSQEELGDALEMILEHRGNCNSAAPTIEKFFRDNKMEAPFFKDAWSMVCTYCPLLHSGLITAGEECMNYDEAVVSIGKWKAERIYTLI